MSLIQGDALSSLSFNLALDSLKSNGTHPLPVFSDEVNSDAVIIASKEIGLELSTDKTKYMVMSRDQNAGRSHKIKVDKSSFESANQFKYFGSTQTN